MGSNINAHIAQLGKSIASQLSKFDNPEYWNATIGLLRLEDCQWDDLHRLKCDNTALRHAWYFLRDLSSFPQPLWTAVRSARSLHGQYRVSLISHLEQMRIESPRNLSSRHQSVPHQSQHSLQPPPASPYSTNSSDGGQLPLLTSQRDGLNHQSVMGMSMTPSGGLSPTRLDRRSDSPRRQAPKGFHYPCPSEGCQQKFVRLGHYYNHLKKVHPDFVKLHPTHQPQRAENDEQKRGSGRNKPSGNRGMPIRHAGVHTNPPPNTQYFMADPMDSASLSSQEVSDNLSTGHAGMNTHVNMQSHPNSIRFPPQSPSNMAPYSAYAENDFNEYMRRYPTGHSG